MLSKKNVFNSDLNSKKGGLQFKKILFCYLTCACADKNS